MPLQLEPPAAPALSPPPGLRLPLPLEFDHHTCRKASNQSSSAQRLVCHIKSIAQQLQFQHCYWEKALTHRESMNFSTRFTKLPKFASSSLLLRAYTCRHNHGSDCVMRCRHSELLSTSVHNLFHLWNTRPAHLQVCPFEICVLLLWPRGKEVVSPHIDWNAGVLGVIAKHACAGVNGPYVDVESFGPRRQLLKL
jgi:hypothetical protein